MGQAGDKTKIIYTMPSPIPSTQAEIMTNDNWPNLIPTVEKVIFRR